MYSAKNHLERIIYIDELIRRCHFPSKSMIIEKFEVSAKTIERDLQYMRDRLEAPLEYCKKNRGYYYSDKTYFLPKIMMNEGELFALIMSIETVKTLGDSELIVNLQESYRKLVKYLPENIKVDLNSLASHSIVVAPPGLNIDAEIWQTVIKAVKSNKKLKLTYQTPGYDMAIERELLPYYLLSSKGGWYILAMNEIRNQIETYAVFRIKKAEILNSKFTIPDDFKPENYIDPELGIFSSTEEYDIEIEFSHGVAPYIKERTWHIGQKITEKKDGSIILQFKTNQLESVQYWLLSWGDGPKVLKPPELKDIMMDVIENMRERYRKNN